VKAGSSQWLLTITIAAGGAGKVAASPSRSRCVACQVSAGPQDHSMKKQGPPPCGRKIAGWRCGFADIVWLSVHHGPVGLSRKSICLNN
jgi:hypothetical protein